MPMRSCNDLDGFWMLSKRGRWICDGFAMARKISLFRCRALMSSLELTLVESS